MLKKSKAWELSWNIGREILSFFCVPGPFYILSFLRTQDFSDFSSLFFYFRKGNFMPLKSVKIN
jgi:hypothetical protein